MRYCNCERFKVFDSMYGGIKILIATPSSLEGMDHYEGPTRQFREVWEFKYCPFCRKKIKDKEKWSKSKTY